VSLSEEERELAEVFRAEAEEILDGLARALLAVEAEGPGGEHQVEAYRLFHTLKGMANMAGLEEVGRLCHDAEAALAPGNAPQVDALLTTLDSVARLLGSAPRTPSLREPGAEGRFVTVDVRRLDTLLNLVGELSVAETRLVYEHGHGDGRASAETVARISHLVRSLQEEIMRAGLLPLRSLFASLPRLVRDAAKAEGKAVRIDLDDANLELDRSMADRMGGVLAHLVQNAVVHGIERPEERVAAGKASEGVIHVRSRRENETVVIEVSDDGRGIDFAAARRRAVAEGLLTAEAAEAASEAELIEVLMQPGFTTAASASRHAGRGIGLTAVEDAVLALGGTVQVASATGKGTRVTVRLPPTVAVVDTLLTLANGATVALPLRNVKRIVSAEGVTTAAGVPAIPYDGLPVPIFTVEGELKRPSEDSFVVIAEALRGLFGVAVDRVVGTHNSILKPLDGSLLGGVNALGATILGSGALALVLDPNSFTGVIPP